jgi:hypothetical protein
MSIPTNNHRITLEQAITMTTLYRARKAQVLNPTFSNVLSISETFNREIFDSLLAQPGAAGIRIYYGMDTNMSIHAILVAVDSNNKDILPPTSTGSTLATNTGASTDSGTIGELGTTCPPNCSSSPLNP